MMKLSGYYVTGGRSLEDAKAVEKRMEEIGTDVVELKFGTMAQAIGQIDLGVTIRRAYDTFWGVEWLLDLSRSRLGPDTIVIRENGIRSQNI